MKRLSLLVAISLFAAPAVWAASPAKPSVAELATGKQVYEKSCAACHVSGLMAAPKTGDKVAWKGLIAEGVPSLTHVAIKGEGNMPAKGGNAALSDDEVRAAVVYMVEQSR